MSQALLMKRRIRSIRSTKKIMKAMELIAAAKWRKAAHDLTGIQEYTNALASAERVTRPPEDREQAHSALARPRDILLVIIASDRGLCGGYHTRLTRFLVQEQRQGRLTTQRVVTVGRRAEPIARRLGCTIEASFPSYAPGTKSKGCRDLLTLLQHERTTSSRAICLAFTRYTNALEQVPTLLHLPSPTEVLTAPDVEAKRFEPTYATVRLHIEERALLAQLLASIYHGSASEQAARVQAMRQASTAASDMLDSLTLELNQTRQAAITRELSELSAGMTAIR